LPLNVRCRGTCEPGREFLPGGTKLGRQAASNDFEQILPLRFARLFEALFGPQHALLLSHPFDTRHVRHTFLRLDLGDCVPKVSSFLEAAAPAVLVTVDEHAVSERPSR
jgi:hypothetical protein